MNIDVTKKPLPVGESFFDSMIENGYYYVDKTLFIKDILDRKAKVSLCTRPRRFGKTLNQTMLKCFFSDVGSPAGRKLKSVDGWNYYSDSYYGTDEFGFSALPGGYGYYDGNFFDDAGIHGNWWTATEDYSDYAYYRYMYFSLDYLYENSDKKEAGLSVRCVSND